MQSEEEEAGGGGVGGGGRGGNIKCKLLFLCRDKIYWRRKIV